MSSASPARHQPPWRLLILLTAGVAVLTGLHAALIRLGLATPSTAVSLGDAHGVLMVYGFIGTAIGLERAVALQSSRLRRDRLAYAAPILNGLGAVTLVASAVAPDTITTGNALPGILWCLSLASLCAIYLRIWQRQPSLALLIQTLGAFLGLAGIALWTGGHEPAALIPWWAGFLILTIAGERLELARVAFATGSTETRVLAEATATALAAGLTLTSPEIGFTLYGLAVAVLAIDLAWHDIARITIRSHGLPRLSAACMLVGYGWLTLAGSIWLIGGPISDGYRYDLVIHSITIGFVLSMIVAHAPIILPAIARRTVPYHPALWVVWGGLQLGLVVRAIAGVRANLEAWQLGGAVNVAALLAFILTVLTLAVTSGRTDKRRSSPTPDLSLSDDEAIPQEQHP